MKLKVPNAVFLFLFFLRISVGSKLEFLLQRNHKSAFCNFLMRKTEAFLNGVEAEQIR